MRLLNFFVELAMGLILVSLPVYILLVSIGLVQFSIVNFFIMFVLFIFTLYAIGNAVNERE